MSRSQKPRRKYDPSRWLRRTLATHAARADAAPLTGDQQRDLGLSYWMAFQTMLNSPNDGAWNTLATSLNIALVLCERGFGSEYEPDIKCAQEALMRAIGRHRQCGSWALDGDGIVAIRTAVEIHDQQMRITERREVRDAIDEVHRRISAGDTLEAA